MSDIVLEAQQWLNATYANRSGYIPVEENGKPGSAFSASLVSALQIELGLSTITGVFGEQTYAQCDATPLSSGEENNRVRILQYALQGKGYDSGTCDGHFGLTTQNALLEIQGDAGLDSSQSSTTATGRQMKAACGVDEYKLIAGGDARVRYIQRTLNHLYLEYTDICAADGVVGRLHLQGLHLRPPSGRGATRWNCQRYVRTNNPNMVPGPQHWNATVWLREQALFKCPNDQIYRARAVYTLLQWNRSVSRLSHQPIRSRAVHRFIQQ